MFSWCVHACVAFVCVCVYVSSHPCIVIFIPVSLHITTRVLRVCECLRVSSRQQYKIHTKNVNEDDRLSLLVVICLVACWRQAHRHPIFSEEAWSRRKKNRERERQRHTNCIKNDYQRVHIKRPPRNITNIRRVTKTCPTLAATATYMATATSVAAT